MKVIKSVLKTILAGVTALAILCLLMYGYYYVPLRENNKYHNTDYVWNANTPWIDLTEGVSFGVTDANGFNNAKVIENPDILFLGSSHLQSMNVMQSENMTFLLNDKFDGKYHAYNMGISGHTFYKVVQYLQDSLNIYSQTPKYVIIETGSVILTKDDVENALSGEIAKTNVIDSGLVAAMYKIPYLRQFYHQLDKGMLEMLLPKDSETASEQTSANSIQSTFIVSVDEEPYEMMFEYLQKVENDYGTEIIIIYHPFETLLTDGNVDFPADEYAETFVDYAQKYDIGFINMTEDFEKMYYEEHHVPHGFCTGELGVGHLNKFGHAAIAQRLYQYLCELEVN